MAGLSKVGKKGLQDGALTTTAASAPTVGAKGELFYNTAENKLYVSNGTAWTRVSNDAPSATGGTVVISTLNEGATFSYNLGTNFTDDSNTDAELTYSLESGTLPGGATLPTSGNSAMTGTVGNVSSNTVYTFSIRATDAAGATATQDYQQQINTVAATVTGGTVTISAVNEGSSASYDVDTDFTFTTGSAFSAYSLLSGSLPSGLSLNTSTGVISGTMGEVSSTTAYSFTIRATDTDGDTADQAYSWTITNVPFTATGGTITTYSGYRVHTFTSSASGASGFVPNKTGTVDVFIVAGGAGGGVLGGGGGAGGVLTPTQSVTAQSYSVIVGGGGLNGSSGASGTNGGNSSVFGNTALGGGGGGCHAGSDLGRPGVAGGSGGGGSDNNNLYGPGAGTSGQGFAGGNGTGHHTDASNRGGGGGGGASEAGKPYNDTSGGRGRGGNGVTNDWLGTSYYFAGGGGRSDYSGSNGGGNGGLGGGGGGCSYNSAGRPGGAGYNAGGSGNTGANVAGGNGGQNSGGGAGANAWQLGGVASGGSGIVIIRYAV